MFVSGQAGGIAVVLLLVREITALLLPTKNLREYSHAPRAYLAFQIRTWVETL
jgi:hypothetical protein